jgi:hypothetical protein
LITRAVAAWAWGRVAAALRPTAARAVTQACLCQVAVLEVKEVRLHFWAAALRER